VAFSRDELWMASASEGGARGTGRGRCREVFLPIPSDLRYNWVRVWLQAIDQTEMRELVVDAWRMVVPKRVAAAYLGDRR
jgi:hypothetical protein